LVEETGEILQIISANNLLPYDNLQTLKTIYDNMQEDFIENLRIIEDILQDLIDDNEKWIRFNDELKRLETLFKDASLMVDSKSFGDKSLEEKQQILQVNESFIIGYIVIWVEIGGFKKTRIENRIGTNFFKFVRTEIEVGTVKNKPLKPLNHRIDPKTLKYVVRSLEIKDFSIYV
jgi:hypothetical protein